MSRAQTATGLVVCFALGQGSFSHDRAHMADFIGALTCFLPPGASLVGTDGSPDSIAIHTDDVAATRTALRAASGLEWVVIPADVVAGPLQSV